MPVGLESVVFFCPTVDLYNYNFTFYIFHKFGYEVYFGFARKTFATKMVG